MKLEHANANGICKACLKRMCFGHYIVHIERLRPLLATNRFLNLNYQA